MKDKLIIPQNKEQYGKRKKTMRSYKVSRD